MKHQYYKEGDADFYSVSTFYDWFDVHERTGHLCMTKQELGKYLRKKISEEGICITQQTTPTKEEIYLILEGTIGSCEVYIEVTNEFISNYVDIENERAC